MINRVNVYHAIQTVRVYGAGKVVSFQKAVGVITGGVTVSDDDPAALAAAADAGSAATASRSDHVHPLPSAADVEADPAGTAASAVSDHLDPHPPPTARDTRNEAAGAVSTHAANASAHHSRPTGALVDLTATQATAALNAATPSLQGMMSAADKTKLDQVRSVTALSAAPPDPSEHDVYLDDGTNTASGNPGWRRYNGAAWEDVSAGASGSGGGLVNTLAELTALAFEYPATGITNPFTSAANSPNVGFDVDNYADKAVLLSTSSNEPLMFPQRFKIPTGCTGLTFRFVYAPETGNTWGGETVIFKGECKDVTDNNAWSAVQAFAIGTDTVPGSGSNPQIYNTTIVLATLGLAVGDVVQMVVFVDSTSTWAHDVALFAATVEASDA